MNDQAEDENFKVILKQQFSDNPFLWAKTTWTLKAKKKNPELNNKF